MNFHEARGSGSIESFLLFLGLALLPVYVFSSGGVQPAHMIFALFFMLVLSKNGLPSQAWLLFLSGITLYSFLLESFYVILGGEVVSLINSVFFLYNVFLVAAVYSYCRRYGLSVFVPGVLAACVLALLAIGLGGISLQQSGDGRATGTFNNPNQLGYFSVCILSLTYLLYSHGRLKYSVAVAAFSAAVFLSIASLSKAAMVANLVVVFFALKPVRLEKPNQKKRPSKAVFSWAVLALVGFGLVLFSYFQGAFDDFIFVERLQGITTEGDSSLESRGYFTFLEGNTLQIFFGLGGGGVLDIVGHEVHSTLASVLNNYGVLGLLLFSGSLVVWAIKLWRAYGFIEMCCLTGPAMLYGITHNGTRFTAFWVLYAASMAMASTVIESQKASVSDRRFSW